MHTLADWGNTEQNVAKSIENTTISTTNGWAGDEMKANVLG